GGGRARGAPRSSGVRAGRVHAALGRWCRRAGIPAPGRDRDHGVRGESGRDSPVGDHLTARSGRPRAARRVRRCGVPARVPGRRGGRGARGHSHPDPGFARLLLVGGAGMTSAEGSLLLDLLDPWLRRQRWFPAKDDPQADLSVLESIDLPDPLQEVACTIVLVRVTPAGGDVVVVQVPLVVATPQQAETGPVPGWIAALDDGALIDGPQHPGFTRAWLAAAELWPQTLDRVPELAPARARVRTGEQSNTSIRVDGRLGGAMLKVFRVLDAGPNPDVQVPSALRASGWQHVPAVLGTLAGSWPHPRSGEQVRGDLGILTALVPRARDGFELACDYARLGRDFTPLATRLGECVAQMHTRLRAAFGTQAHDGAAPLAGEGAVASGLGAQLQQRCRW